MEPAHDLLALLEQGHLAEVSSLPRKVETVISRIYIYDAEDLVLKIYKRDNDWWNSMHDISGGASRREYILRDFAFNHLLNPSVYNEVKAAKIVEGRVQLYAPEATDDELIIVMRKENVEDCLTNVLVNPGLTAEDFFSIGKQFAETKSSLPRSLLPMLKTDYFTAMLQRTKDLESWVRSAEAFPAETVEDGLRLFNNLLQRHRPVMEKMHHADMVVLMDCNAENLIYTKGELRFMDAFPPQDAWRGGAKETDIYRVGSDIYALAGKKAYEKYLEGVRSVTLVLDETQESFYLLYGALIMGPYLFMLQKKDMRYKDRAEQYLAFIQEFIAREKVQGSLQ